MSKCKCGLPLTDGYHTMDELYEHRHVLLAGFVNCLGELYMKDYPRAFKSRLHSDGTSFDGMFIVMGYLSGKQFSYHVEDEYWDLFKVEEKPNADEWDGHTSLDVIEIIKDFCKEMK